MSRSDRVTKGITRVVEKRNITTGRQMNLRLTAFDDDALSILVERLQKIIPQKNISRSRALRAIGYLNKDKDVLKKIAESIIEKT